MSRFKAHLHTVNESYLQHMLHALSFTLALFIAAVCCLVHAFVPFLFVKRGSTIVQRLYERMVVNRDKLTPAILTSGASDHRTLPVSSADQAGINTTRETFS